jgi:hypothetical protein
LLDDIDTLSDIIKPSTLETYKAYHDKTLQIAAHRAEILESDGFDLFKNGQKIT